MKAIFNGCSTPGHKDDSGNCYLTKLINNDNNIVEVLSLNLMETSLGMQSKVRFENGNEFNVNKKDLEIIEELSNGN